MLFDKSSVARGAIDLRESVRLSQKIDRGPRARCQKPNPLRPTAADKARTVTEADARRIFEIAKACTGLLDRILTRYVKFTPIFGLRPGEWRHAALRRGRWLVVRNANQTASHAYREMAEPQERMWSFSGGKLVLASSKGRHRYGGVS